MMKKNRTITCLCLIVMCATLLNGAIAFNDLVCAFNDQPEKQTIENNVVSGASYYLLSKSFADLFLMEYEESTFQSFNFESAISSIDKAIANLELSKEKYRQAKDIGARLGYISQKVSWFENFTYDNFVAANKLNSEIASRVKVFLEKCDIVGIYNQNIIYIDEILATLYEIKKQLDEKSKPSKAEVWRLLQQYSETLLFGNYATMMGQSVLENCNSTTSEN